MNKPTIFFSHSSRDEKALGRLKSKIQEYTGGTIDVFLSSDGQSIPFGRNWVHSIEEALERSKIMLVFISPISMQSHWVYFESGYSYSKGIEVIPIGIPGMDLNQIPSPLNLLQGFNINSKDGLNNIINIINNKFDFTHRESFSDSDFSYIFTDNEISQSELFGEYYHFIDHIEFLLYNTIKEETITYSLIYNCMEEIKKYFIKNKIEFGEEGNSIFINGCKITELSTYREGRQLNITVDTVLAKRNIAIIHDLMTIIYDDYTGLYFLKILLKGSTTIITDDYKISSRLHGSGVKFSKTADGLLEFKNIMFSIDCEEPNRSDGLKPPPSLRIVYNIKELNEIPMQSLLEILFRNGILS